MQVKSMQLNKFTSSVEGLDVIALLKSLKKEKFLPSSVSIEGSSDIFGALIVFNDNPNFYISNKKLRLTNMTADGCEFILDLDGKLLGASWDMTPDKKAASVTITDNSFCATIDFYR